MLDLIARYKHLIKSFHVLLYEQERESLRFKAQVIFTDSSNLYVKEYLFENKERKYSYHWSDSLGNLICRWDNADHWPQYHLPELPQYHLPELPQYHLPELRGGAGSRYEVLSKSR
jgi:hypothetical protein